MILIIVGLFVMLLFLGLPIAFSMAAATIVGLFATGTPIEIFIQQLSSGVNSFPFLAIPLFVLAGSLMETGGIANRLIHLSRGLVGHFRGGLGMVAVVSEILFSGISGSSIADASAMSALLLPAMKSAGYAQDRSVCIIAAASGMGILIPPCLTMIVLGAISNISIAALFIAGFLPGLCMALMLMALISYQAKKGLLPEGEKRFPMGQMLRVLRSSLIPLLMPVIIFGGILGGVATTTEVAVLAVIYAVIVGLFYYKEIKWPQLPGLLLSMVRLTGSVMFLAGIAMAFSWVMAAEQVPQMIGSAIKQVTQSPHMFLLISNLVFVFFSGLMDGLPAILIFFPILSPIAADFGINPLHFALLSVACSGIGLVLPPLGMLLIVVSAVGKIELTKLVKPMLPYVAILIAGLMVITYIPWITLVLPRMVFSSGGY
jgi:tripartite ATP-independent transporter DctM subunit